MYLNGEGVPKSVVKAITWWKIASMYGSKDSLDEINNISSKFSSAEHAQAMKAAEDCYRRKLDGCT
jgi:hypothetical protein